MVRRTYDLAIYMILREDPEFLDLLMLDLKKAPPRFQPTNYWRHYQKALWKWIRRNGFENFRYFNNGRVATIRAGIAFPEPMSVRFHRLTSTKFVSGYRSLIRRLRVRFPLISILDPLELERMYFDALRKLQASEYRCCRLVDHGWLDQIEDSGLGNPYDLFEMNGKRYSLAFLRNFQQMAWLLQQMPRPTRILEIGPGYGASVEVFAKTFPVHYWVFDLPPQLYVASQYLSAVFSGEVYTYDHLCRGEDTSNYRIVCLPSWCLDRDLPKFDLFINSASFQEMEPHIVENYCSILRSSVEWVYLWQLIDQTHRRTSNRSGGVEQPLSLQDYPRIFGDFKVFSTAPYDRFNGSYFHMLLRKG